MENKKSEKANLEQSKSMFLLIGFITVISVMIFAFSWNSVKVYSDVNPDESYIEEETIASTTQDEEKIEEKIEKPAPKKVIAEIIHLSDDPNLIDTTPIWTEDEPIYDEPEIFEETDNEPLIYAGIMPEFPGGKKALQVWVARHVVYPALARENNIQGTVHLRFEVTKQGKIGKIEVLNTNIDMLLQDASKEVIKKLPDFKPGMQNGEYVNVWFSIPINFVLNNNH